MTVANRMYALILIAAIGLFSLMGISYYQMNRIYEATNYANENTAPSVESLDSALAEFELLNSLIWQHLLNTDNAKMQAIEAKVAETHQKLTDTLDAYLKTNIRNEKDKAFLESDLAMLAEYDQMGGQILTLSLSNKKKRGT